MRKPTHVLGGVTSGLMTSQLLMHTTPMTNASVPLGIGAIMAGSFIGSVLCDIDHPNSFIGRRIPILPHLIRATFGHRGATHSLLFAFLVSVLTALPSVYVFEGLASVCCLLFAIGLFVGVCSHLFLDALTVSGVPLLYPFSKKMFRIGRFRTGSAGETFVFVLLILVTGYLISGMTDSVIHYVLG